MLPLAAIAIVFTLIGGPEKLSRLPVLARWGLLACMAFALIEPWLPGKRIGGHFLPSTEALALSRPLRTFWRVLLIIYICCFVAETIGIAWLYGKVPLKYALIGPAVTLVLIAIVGGTLRAATNCSKNSRAVKLQSASSNKTLLA